MHRMIYDYSKRGYLLPKGCKDLMDVLRLEAHEKVLTRRQKQKSAVALTPVSGNVVIPEHTTVLQLASILHQKPVQIIADLMELGMFAIVTQELAFDTIAKVAQIHGCVARRAA